MDQNIIDIIVRGAEQAVRQITGVSESQTRLAQIQQQAADSQTRSYEQVTKAAQAAADAQVQAAQRAQEAAEQAAKATAGASGAARNPTTGRFIGQQAAQQIQQQLQAAAAPQIANLGGLTQRIAAAQAGGGQAAAQAQATTQSVQQQVSALQALARAAQQAAAAQNVNTKAGAQAAAQLLATARAANAQAAALSGVINQSSRASTGGITYLSVLSAIHAASFLATNQTFSMIGSFVTLGAAFGKLGLAGAGAGLAVGGLLAIFGQVSQAVQQVQSFVISAAEGILKFAAGAAAAAVAAGAAGVKIAGGVETQLASVRAFGEATTEQLQQVSAQATELSNRFGVSAASVVEATSLFARAGGTVQQAIDGATEAIIKLQIASQGELSAAQAAILVSATLKQFSLAGDQAARVADNLVAGFQNSALSALGFQQALIQAGPGAAALGISLEDLTTAIALIGDRLVKGTITGTAFKQAILDIINPSKAAQEIFNQYGITVKDASGAMRPFIDIVADLNAAFGAMVDEEGNVIKQQDAATIAALGGARAFLGFNVLIQQGAEGFQKYRDALAKTTATNITDVLLLPMEAQLKRVQTAAENTGRAFGGPLLGPVRESLSAAANFLAQIAPLAELAGQAVAVVLTQQGFGALQVKIDEVVGHNALASFLIELVNSARNVADVVTSQIIPAIQTFIQTIANAANQNSALDSIGTAFDNVNRSIQSIGAAVATGIVAIGNLVVEFAKGEGAGGRLRDTLVRVGSAVLTNLVASFSTAVITIQAAIVAMPIFARTALLTAQFVIALANVVNSLRIAFSLATTKLAPLVLGLTALSQISSANIGAAIGTIERLAEALSQSGADGEALRASILADTQAMNAMLTGTTGLLTELDDLPKKLAKLGEEGANPVIEVFQNLQGEIATALDNVNQTIEQKSREAAQRGPAKPGVVSVDQKAVDKETAKIDNSFRRLATQIDHTVRDAKTKAEEAVKSSLERIDDIVTNAQDRLKQIERDRKEAISDLITGIKQQRADRDFLRPIQQAQEDALTAEQRRLDKEGTEEQRALDRIRTARQQAQQDNETLYQRDIQKVETTEQRRIELVERAFAQIQQAQETAFSRSQDAELTSFQRSQQAAAEARQFQLRLANAKTPEERQQLQKDRQQALQDTKFQQGQEDALTAFRNKQEDARTKFQQNQQLASIVFRQGLEDSFTAFRQKNEDKFTAYKRGVEARELFFEQAEDDVLLKHRQDREDELTKFRRQQALDLQKFQDDLEDAAAKRRIAKINREAGEAADKATQAALKQLKEVQDALTLSQGKALDQLGNALQNVIDQADNLKESLRESLPPEIFSAVSPRIDALTTSLKGAARAATQDFKATQQAAQETIDAAVAVGQAQLATTQPIVQPTQTVVTPSQVLAVQSIQAANVVLPPGFTIAVASAVAFGINQAVEQGILPSDFQVDLTPIEDDVQSIRRALRG